MFHTMKIGLSSLYACGFSGDSRCTLRGLFYITQGLRFLQRCFWL